MRQVVLGIPGEAHQRSPFPRYARVTGAATAMNQHSGQVAATMRRATVEELSMLAGSLSDPSEHLRSSVKTFRL